MSEKAGLLSRASYDADAASVHSDHELHSGDDGESDAGRDTLELAERDRELLASEDEREELFSGGSTRGPIKKIFDRARGLDSEKVSEKKEKRKSRKSRKRQREEESELMYEMEEGGKLPSSGPSRDSSESDLQRLGALQGEKTVCTSYRQTRIATEYICRPVEGVSSHDLRYMAP